METVSFVIYYVFFKKMMNILLTGLLEIGLVVCKIIFYIFVSFSPISR